jgi:hypothetical protein
MPITGIIGHARAFANDFDDVDPALNDDIYTALTNERLLLHGLSIDRRIDEVSALTAGLTFTAGLKVKLATPTTWYEIVKAYLVSAAGDVYGKTLDLRPMAEIAQLQDDDTQDDGSVNTGEPEKVAFEQIATATSADSGRYNVRLWPVPDQTWYVGVLARSWKTELASASDIPDVTPLGAYAIAREVAADAAAMFGEDQTFIAGILRLLPEEKAAIERIRRPKVSRPTGVARMMA